MCALTSGVENFRLATLRRYRILDSAPEQSFDDLTTTAAVACRTAAAFISFIDGDRLWFKSTFGFTRDEIPRGFAFCDDVLGSGDLVVVEDSLADRRYADSPLVTGPPHARFYAGVPYSPEMLRERLEAELSAGAGLLAKPYEAEALGRKVREALDARPASASSPRLARGD